MGIFKKRLGVFIKKPAFHQYSVARFIIIGISNWRLPKPYTLEARPAL